MLATLAAERWLVFAAAKTADQWPLVIDTHKDERGKYGRWIADIYNAAGESLADHLRAHGHEKQVDA